MGRLLKEAAHSLSKNPRRERERRSLFASIVPGGVYGGDGAIFAAENPIFQSENRFLAVSAPENPQDFSGNWRGAHEGRRLWRKQAVVSPMRAKETAQPVAAIAVDEPSEAGSAASELANDAERPC